MQTEADVRKVLDAAMEGPAGEDDDMESVRNTLRWVLGYETLVPGNATAEEFIRVEIDDPYL